MQNIVNRCGRTLVVDSYRPLEPINLFKSL